MNDEQRTAIRREVDELRVAIMASRCDYCNAQPGHRCQQNAHRRMQTSTRGYRGISYTSQPHMVRVYAGHSKVKRRTT